MSTPPFNFLIVDLLSYVSMLLLSSRPPSQLDAGTSHYSTSKVIIHFPLNKPLPTALIKKLVKARVAQPNE